MPKHAQSPWGTPSSKLGIPGIPLGLPLSIPLNKTWNESLAANQRANGTIEWVIQHRPQLAQLCNPTAKGSSKVPGLFRFFGACIFVSPVPDPRDWNPIDSLLGISSLWCSGWSSTLTCLPKCVCVCVVRSQCFKGSTQLCSCPRGPPLQHSGRAGSICTKTLTMGSRWCFWCMVASNNEPKYLLWSNGLWGMSVYHAGPPMDPLQIMYLSCSLSGHCFGPWPSETSPRHGGWSQAMKEEKTHDSEVNVCQISLWICATGCWLQRFLSL